MLSWVEKISEYMSQKIYTYGFPLRVVRFFVLTAMFWMPAYILLNAFVFNSWNLIFSNNYGYWFAFILAILIVMLNAATLGHMFSNIKTDETGLYVEYLWGYAYIPWDMVELKVSTVYSESLPFFYFSQGLLFRLSFKKMILIFPYIANYNELLAEIYEKSKGKYKI
jgi:hypothetical protein